MRWDAKFYQDKHNYSTSYGKSMFELIPENPAQSILDIGCGTGDLTAELKKYAAQVVGIDSSPEMIALAKASHPEAHFMFADATKLTFKEEFDVVFSNAVFHWIKDLDKQNALLFGIANALKPGGKLICEFGGENNITRIMKAYKTAYEKVTGSSPAPRWFYPSEDQYRSLLLQNGLSPDMIILFDRPTPLIDGERGMENWIRQFYSDELAQLPEDAQQKITDEISSLLKPELWDDANSQWIADYRRIRVVATRSPLCQPGHHQSENQGNNQKADL